MTGDRLGSVRGVSRNCSGSVLEIVRGVSWQCLESAWDVCQEVFDVRLARLMSPFGVSGVPAGPKNVNSASFLGQRLLVAAVPQFQKEKKERLIKTFFSVTKLGHRQSSFVSREMNPRFAEAHFFNMLIIIGALQN